MEKQGISATVRDAQLGRNGRRRLASRRVMAVALAGSALFHVLVVILYSVSSPEWDFALLIPVGDTPATPVEGTQVVRIVEVPPDAPLVEVQEEPKPEPAPEDAPTSPAPPSESTTPSVDDAPNGVKASEALRVRSADPRLWRAAEPEAHELTANERMQLELAGRLEAWNDSVRALVAAEEALTDWTRTGENGERWGVSPGKIHLGKLTLPLPFGFGTNPWMRERAARRAFEDADIRNGAAASFMADYWKERVEAIRRRRDREREKARSDSAEAKPGGNSR
ncbi:MAG: hypothetical protein BMS9Abin29_1414 [Gemmatimonadota bacterium]|nr:MAG: hypothetical protein BMS9Abin29_1414 [Gemmatimonadota bacterium]